MSRPGKAEPRSPTGFTLIETLLVLTIAFILLGIAIPRLVGTRGRVAVENARSQATSAVSLARSTSSRYGRTAYLLLDVTLDRLDVRVDTSQFGGQPPASLHTVDLRQDLGIDLQATYPVICFDPRGFALPAGVCPGTAVTMRLGREGVLDSVVVSSTGLVSR